MVPQHEHYDGKPNDHLETPAEPPTRIPASIAADIGSIRLPVVSPTNEEDDPAQGSGVAPHRRPFKKRLRQISTVKTGSQEVEDADDNDNDNGQDDELDELASSPPLLERQSASVYAVTPTHQLVFAKHASIRTLPVLSPESAPKTFFDGKSGARSAFSSPNEFDNKSNGYILPDKFSERLEKVSSPFGRRSPKTLYPSVQAQSMRDLPDDEGLFSTKKQCHHEEHQEPAITIAKSPAPVIRPNRVTPTPGAPVLTLAAATAESSRTSYEQVLTKQDSHRNGLGLGSSARNLDLSGNRNREDPPNAKGPRASVHNRKSFRLETQPREEYLEDEEEENCVLPQFLRTLQGRKTATVQDVMDVLVIPPRRASPSLTKEVPPMSSYSYKLFEDIIFNPIQEPTATLKKPPPSSTPASKPKAAPPKEFTTCAWPVEPASFTMHPVELPGMVANRKQPPSYSTSQHQHSTSQHQFETNAHHGTQTSQYRWEFNTPTCARPGGTTGDHGMASVSRKPPPTQMPRSRHLTQSCREFTTCARPNYPGEPMAFAPTQEPFCPEDQFCVPSRGLKPPPPPADSKPHWMLPSQSSRHRTAFIPLTDMVLNGYPHAQDIDYKPAPSPAKCYNTPLRCMPSPGDQKPLYKPSPMEDMCFSPVSSSRKLSKPSPHKAPRRASDYASAPRRVSEYYPAF